MKLTPLKRGNTPMKRTPLLRFGARRKREGKSESRFRRLVMRRAYDATIKGHCCERCGIFVPVDKTMRGRWRIRAHHVVPRSRAPGWPGLHEPSNGAALCTKIGTRTGCHERVHDHVAQDWPNWLREPS